MCRLLRVSRSGYYAWRSRPASARDVANQSLASVIKDVHERSRRTYGVRRVHAELKLDYDLRVSRKRVARLMRLHGLTGVQRRKGGGRRGRPHATHDDHVAGDFNQETPNRVWMADVTQHPTGEGWLYLAVVIDACGRRVIGWAMNERVTTELVLAALSMAQHTRKPPPGLIHHSDQGAAYTSLRFGRHLNATGAVGSMGRSGTPADNAVVESFFASLQTELLDRQSWPTRDDLRTAIFEYIEIFYNRQRRHSTLDYLSPNEYERRHHQTQAPSPATPSP